MIMFFEIPSHFTSMLTHYTLRSASFASFSRFYGKVFLFVCKFCAFYKHPPSHSKLIQIQLGIYTFYTSKSTRKGCVIWDRFRCLQKCSLCLRDTARLICIHGNLHNISSWNWIIFSRFSAALSRLQTNIWIKNEGSSLYKQQIFMNKSLLYLP